MKQLSPFEVDKNWKDKKESTMLNFITDHPKQTMHSMVNLEDDVLMQDQEQDRQQHDLK